MLTKYPLARKRWKPSGRGCSARAERGQGHRLAGYNRGKLTNLSGVIELTLVNLRKPAPCSGIWPKTRAHRGVAPAGFSCAIGSNEEEPAEISERDLVLWARIRLERAAYRPLTLLRNEPLTFLDKNNF